MIIMFLFFIFFMIQYSFKYEKYNSFFFYFFIKSRSIGISNIILVEKGIENFLKLLTHHQGYLDFNYIP